MSGVTHEVATGDAWSALALWQAGRVAELLGGDVELVIVKTTGDQRADVPIHEIGGSGMFVKEVQLAVLEGRADLAQHSAKDLPAITPDGLRAGRGARTGRPPGCAGGLDVRQRSRPARRSPPVRCVGAPSLRRLRPDLTFAELRGNVDTRLEKASQFDAIVLAAAGLDRLGRGDRITERLDTGVMLPMVGQGALAVECRADDDATRERLAAIDDVELHTAVRAERAFLAELGGGCTLPCAAFATVDRPWPCGDRRVARRARRERGRPRASDQES